MCVEELARLGVAGSMRGDLTVQARADNAPWWGGLGGYSPLVGLVGTVKRWDHLKIFHNGGEGSGGLSLY